MLDQLPSEVVWKVLSYLDVFSVPHVALVSRRWAQITMDDSLWKFYYCALWEEDKNIQNIKTGCWRAAFKDIWSRREVHIIVFNGRKIRVPINLNMLGCDLVDQACQNPAVCEPKCVLLHRLHKIVADKPLKDQKVTYGSTLYLMLRFRGCGLKTSAVAPKRMYPPLPICELNPDPSIQNISTKAFIGVRFHTPVKLAANGDLKKALQLYLHSEPMIPISGRIAMSDSAIVFIPKEFLAFDTVYHCCLSSDEFDPSCKDEVNALLGDKYNWTYRTAQSWKRNGHEPESRSWVMALVRQIQSGESSSRTSLLTDDFEAPETLRGRRTHQTEETLPEPQTESTEDETGQNQSQSQPQAAMLPPVPFPQLGDQNSDSDDGMFFTNEDDWSTDEGDQEQDGDEGDGENDDDSDEWATDDEYEDAPEHNANSNLPETQ